MAAEKHPTTASSTLLPQSPPAASPLIFLLPTTTIRGVAASETDPNSHSEAVDQRVVDQPAVHKEYAKNAANL